MKRVYGRFTKNVSRQVLCGWGLLAGLVLISFYASAQDGVAGLNEANLKVRSYFVAGTNLMYACGSVLGLVGAIKVFTKWNQGDNDTSKVAASWFGSCIFLVVVATVIKSFFNV
ncbi:carbamoyl phosphate synthetase [Dyadobacter luteus]|uniref:Carbamoyl phosphate synthetase n=1 Tax=Dyadobacter luteus TaxID=2259619 RepID=A0A3D8Y9N6_9BACT|nr:DUF4134 domain-containing protein [Dyadobacter luteus]REA60174.1 carbamoyl phosphate synthetase [Dyadobacter luteus]